MDDVLDIIYKGMETKRFHCFRTIREQNVGEHTAGVALLYDYLAGEEATVLGYKAALYHDLAEQEFGDMPAPVKRRLPDVEGGITFRQFFTNMEESYLRQFGLHTDGLSQQDARWVKMADAADGAMFCIIEAEMGNRRMLDVGALFARYYDDLVNGAPHPSYESPREKTLLRYISLRMTRSN